MNELIRLQLWLKEVLLERNTDFFTYARKLSSPTFEPDGAVIVLLSAFLNRLITLVHQKGVWRSCPSDTDDIVIASTGHNKFYPTQVGKCYKIF